MADISGLFDYEWHTHISLNILKSIHPYSQFTTGLWSRVFVCCCVHSWSDRTANRLWIPSKVSEVELFSPYQVSGKPPWIDSLGNEKGDSCYRQSYSGKFFLFKFTKIPPRYHIFQFSISVVIPLSFAIPLRSRKIQLSGRRGIPLLSEW
jgi:hypothetical protein